MATLKFHIAQTLVGFGPGLPDQNRRILCHGFKKIATFNYDMKIWSESDNKALIDLVKYLNSLNITPPD
jgi:hypothetical protein